MVAYRLISLFFALALAPCALSLCYAEPPRPAQSHYAKGKDALKRSDYNNALAHLLKYIDATETRMRNADKEVNMADSAMLMDAYFNVGGIYSVYSDFAQALEVYKKGCAISQTADDVEMQFKFMSNMVGASCCLKNADYATQINERIRRLRGIDRGRQAYYYSFNRGLIAGCRGDHRGKARWMKNAIETVNRYHLPEEMKIYAYSEIYQCYENQGDFREALAYLSLYDSLAHVMNQAYLYVDCYKGLMRIYTKMGDKEKALYYQSAYFRYTDSLLNINEYSRIRTNFQTGEQLRRDNQINNLEKTNTLQKTLLVTLTLLVIVSVAAVIVFYRQRQKLHAANLELYRRNRELLEAEGKYHKSIERQAQQPTADAKAEPDGQAAATSVRDDLVQKVMAVMENEEALCNPEFSLPMLARMAESNTTYVSQAINTTFGKNFRSLVNECRIKLAMKRMMDTDSYGRYSIQGISESVGFKSASNFIAAFKKMTGMTPSLYQKLSGTTI